MATYISSEGDTVDYVCWKYYGQTDKQTVEQVLAANRGLADLGAILPAGVRVDLPVLAKPTVAQGVKLWD